MQSNQKTLLETMEGNQKTLLEKLDALDKKFDKRFDAFDKKVDVVDKKVDAFDKKVDALDKKVDAFDKKVDAVDKKVDALDVGQKELLATMSCLPRAFSSVAIGLREAAAGGSLHALVAASPADCAAWLLTAAGFAQYAPMLAPLGGATLLLQTPASLTLAGVAPQHVAPLLEKIIAAAQWGVETTKPVDNEEPRSTQPADDALQQNCASSEEQVTLAGGGRRLSTALHTGALTT